MNLTEQKSIAGKRSRIGACVASCRKLLTQIDKTKNAIFAEFREAVQTHEHLLHLALNEAEALAWQTEYPHLVFPALATEKAHALASWHERQRGINSGMAA